ncbi:MAG: hypothetical protein ACTSVI_10685 [Promethearchaeota archaeon]
MILKKEKTTCPECGNEFFTKTKIGLTCTKCGLILDEFPEIQMRMPIGREGKMISNAIFNANISTKIGYTHERCTPKEKKLDVIQSRCITYKERKRTRAYNEIMRILAALNLSSSLVHHGMFVFDKVHKQVKPGTKLANADNLALMALYNSVRILGLGIFKGEFIEAAGIERKEFDSLLLKYTKLIKEKCPSLKIHASKTQNLVLSRAQEITRQCLKEKNIDGITIINIIKKVNEILRRYYTGMKLQSIIGVLVYISVNILDSTVLLTDIANKVKYSASSLYNATSRMMKKMKGKSIGKLTKVDFKAFFNINT